MCSLRLALIVICGLSCNGDTPRFEIASSVGLGNTSRQSRSLGLSTSGPLRLSHSRVFTPPTVAGADPFQRSPLPTCAGPSRCGTRAVGRHIQEVSTSRISVEQNRLGSSLRNGDAPQEHNVQPESKWLLRQRLTGSRALLCIVWSVLYGACYRYAPCTSCHTLDA